MITDTSPWLFQLRRSRAAAVLQDDTKTDIAIIGAGIAGVTTAYFVLKYTSFKVILIEAGKVAHGATGHNAGQIASYFERPFADIVAEFGLEMAADGQKSIDSAWQLIEEIYADAGLETLYQQFTGYAGCGSREQVMAHLKDIALQRQGGIVSENMLIAEEALQSLAIPKEFSACYSIVHHEDILSLLQTKDTHYIAALSKRKGCMNSAMFTEELVGYLLATYKNRFTLAEYAPVDFVLLQEKTALIAIEEKKNVIADRVVLYTNGFEKLAIINTFGSDIDAKFHKMVRGSVGYMAGYLDTFNQPPTAISYLPDHVDTPGDALEADTYFYLTRRPFEDEKKRPHNLVCIGGPEALMDDTNQYHLDHPYPEEAQEKIDAFLKKTYAHAPGKITYRFRWHGLMGFTPNSLRCVGPEKNNPVLLYNIGCNGVGILSSIYGARRISRILAKEKVRQSIFDPIRE